MAKIISILFVLFLLLAGAEGQESRSSPFREEMAISISLSNKLTRRLKEYQGLRFNL
jgi:hypothetical protein